MHHWVTWQEWLDIWITLSYSQVWIFQLGWLLPFFTSLLSQHSSELRFPWCQMCPQLTDNGNAAIDKCTQADKGNSSLALTDIRLVSRCVEVADMHEHSYSNPYKPQYTLKKKQVAHTGECTLPVLIWQYQMSRSMSCQACMLLLFLWTSPVPIPL